MFFNLFTIHIMLPFSRSALNVFALGPELLVRAQDNITAAYLISSLGYVSIILGGSLWKVSLGVGARRILSGLIELPTHGSMQLLSSRRLLIVQGSLALAMMTCILGYYFSVAGFGFNLRDLLLVNTGLRPIAQFSAFYAVLIGSYCSARFYEYRERSMGLICTLIIVGLLFYGERSALAGIFQLTVLVALLRKGRRVSLLALFAGLSSLFALAFLLNALRSGTFSFSSLAADILISTFFGNSFSDTRDFAVVLSFWDRHLFWGTTYLAGITAFVPRFLSTFRDTWALGVVTASLAGFSPLEHPGLRIGIAGEAYLNFGLVGVCVLGVFVGAGYRLMDLRMKQCVNDPSGSKVRAYSFWIITTMLVAFQNTSAASTFYSILLIFFISWVMLKVFRLVQLPTD
jgi:hypothetical protein